MRLYRMSHFFYCLLISSGGLLLPQISLATSFSLSTSSTIVNQWTTGYQVEVVVTNNTSNPTQSWQAQFSLPTGEKISSFWNGVYTVNGNIITVNNPTWVGGGVIPAGASTTFGMVIAMPINGVVGISNVTATANGNVTPPPPVVLPVAPVLQSINNPNQSNQFQVQWNAVDNAQKYILQQSQSSSFTQFTTIFNGNNTSVNVVVGAAGTYYYRVFASNSSGVSPASNSVSTMVAQQPPSTSSYIIDSYWESWNSQDSVNTIVNMKVDVINISFANFTTIGTHQYQIGGVEAGNATIQQLVNAAHALNKKVRLSVGGATYPISYQLKTDADAVGMAQAVAQYITNNNLDGVDYDIEDYPAVDLQISLLQNTRQLLPNKIISYTAKSPASTTYPYNSVIQGGYQYVDYVSIMAYDYAPGYTYQNDVQALLSMGIPASKIVIGLMPGLDDVGVTTTLANITTAANYIKTYHLKGIMFWDLNRDLENLTGLGASQATNTAWTLLHS